MRHGRIVLLGATVLALALRAAWPLADPPPRLSWSSGLLSDPAAIVHSARNLHVHGSWVVDASRDHLFFPLTNLLTALVWQVFGVSRLGSQLLAAVLGTIVVILLSLSLGRSAGRVAAAFGAVVLAADYWLTMFSRVPLAENVAGVLLAGAALAALSDGSRWPFLAGALGVGAALFGKLHALAFLPALAVYLVLRRGSATVLVAPVSGGAVAAALWTFVVFLPNRADFLDQLGRADAMYGSLPILTSVKAALAAPLVAIRESWLAPNAPVLSGLGAWFALTTIFRAGPRRRRVRSGTALFALWATASWIYLSLLPYRAPRYFTFAALPLFAAAVAQVVEWVDRSGGDEPAARVRFDPATVVGGYVLVFAALDAIYHYLVWTSFELRSSPLEWRLRLSDALRASDWIRHLPNHLLLALGVAVAILAADRLGIPPRRWGSRRRLALVLTGVVLAASLGRWTWWAAHRTYALEETKEEVHEFLGERAILFGAFAPALVQDTDRVAIPVFGGTPEPDDVRAVGITHVVVTQPGGSAALDRLADPERFRRDFVNRWPLRLRHVRHLEIHRIAPIPSTPFPAYTATPLERAVEMILQKRPGEALAALEAHRVGGGRELAGTLSLEARARFLQGDLPGARRLLEDAIGRRPTRQDDFLNLGYILLEQGDRDLAVETWRRGLRLDPSHSVLEGLLRRHSR